MSDTTEQRQVLDMLSEGKINLDDAERLLARLAELGPEPVEREPRRAAPARPQLRIISRTEDGDGIDVRMPLQLLATGIELEKLLPEAAREAIEETGIELSELSNLRGEDLADAIQDLELDLTSADGATLSIRCE